MKRISLPLVFLLVLVNSLIVEISQAQIKFQLAIGGAGFDYANTIIRTTDGGYAVAGVTASFGAPLMDIYIVKLNSIGTLQWSKTIRRIGISYWEANSIIQTTNGGYAVVASPPHIGIGGSQDIFIAILDGSGTLQWSKTIGDTNANFGQSIVQTTDGGFAVAGYTFTNDDADLYITKIDGSGMLQWSRTIGGTGNDFAESIIQTTDGGYAVAGETESFGAGNTDFYIVKLNSSGTLQWSKTIGGTGDDAASSIIQTTDGGYTVAGFTKSFGADSADMYIVNLSTSGNLLWSKTFGGTDDDFASSITRTTDGGYAVAGSTESFGADSTDFYIVKINTSGTLQWSRTIGGSGNEAALSIMLATDGGFAVAGYTSSFGLGQGDMYIVKLDAGGNTCGNSFSPPSISGNGGISGSPTSIVAFLNASVTSQQNLTGTGGTLSVNCTSIGIQPISNEIPSSFSLSQNYPNPFNPRTIINFQIQKSGYVTLKIYDMLGSEVVTLVNEQLKAGKYQADWDGSNYASGVYYYSLTTESFKETKKMMLVK